MSRDKEWCAHLWQRHQFSYDVQRATAPTSGPIPAPSLPSLIVVSIAFDFPVAVTTFENDNGPQHRVRLPVRTRLFCRRRNIFRPPRYAFEREISEVSPRRGARVHGSEAPRNGPAVQDGEASALRGSDDEVEPVWRPIQGSYLMVESPCIAFQRDDTNIRIIAGPRRCRRLRLYVIFFVFITLTSLHCPRGRQTSARYKRGFSRAAIIFTKKIPPVYCDSSGRRWCRSWCRRHTIFFGSIIFAT
mmetsp:Transcript_1283/g.2617  ORF Transcript_1283/g.2617 Transcript_1283/m.2617 type:complete len:245 (-) Transcript_1283:161-895(-)